MTAGIRNENPQTATDAEGPKEEFKGFTEAPATNLDLTEKLAALKRKMSIKNSQ